MYALRRARARQIVKWESCRVLYHSGDGVFGHRPRAADNSETASGVLTRRFENCRSHQLVEAYRTHGHKRASIDNVDYKNKSNEVQELNLSRYGLSAHDQVDLGLVYGASGQQPVEALVQRLEDIYCGPISYEFAYLESEAEREWFAERVEGTPDPVDCHRRVEIVTELLHSQAWDQFLGVKFPTIKRYCGEGAESLLTFFSTLFRLTTSESVEHIVLGMAHRGKLNALAGALRCPPVKIFHKFSGNPEFPDDAAAACDISTHLKMVVGMSLLPGNQSSAVWDPLQRALL